MKASTIHKTNTYESDRFLSENIDITLPRALHSRNGNEVVSEF